MSSTDSFEGLDKRESLEPSQLMMSTDDLQIVGFAQDKLPAVKRFLLGGRSYSDRVSLAFAFRVMMIKHDLGEDHFVLDEVDYLEGLRPHSKTKPEMQFRHHPLHPLWHKHFSSPRHFVRNIGERWGLRGRGNRDLMTMIQTVADSAGSDVDHWPSLLAHELIIDGSEQRVKWGLTGDWIVYGKHEGQNYYLAIATHEEVTIQRPSLISFGRGALLSSRSCLHALTAETGHEAPPAGACCHTTGRE